jgi:hypothetical protein
MQDLNALSVGLLGHYGFTVGDANDNTMLNKTVASLSTTEKSILQARGVVLPYAGFPTGQMLWQSLRPYPQYNAGITPASAPRGRSWYDSLQVQVNKRYSHGLLINANYTLAKNLESSSLADVFNPNYANKDISVNNLPQQIQVNFEYQVPRPASYIPVLGSRWISQAIGGWGVAMSLRYQSGAYIGRATNGSANPISRWLGGRGPGGAQLKRDANGNYLNPWSVDWTDYSGNRHTEPIDINCHCFDPEKNIVLNPNVWESIPDAQWAGEANRLPFFRGTRLPRESGNLSRNFKFGKDGRYALQVRVEFQNVFNRLLLPASPTLGAFNAAPTKQADGRYTQGFGTFGNLRGAGAFGAERSGVFVGRLTF